MGNTESYAHEHTSNNTPHARPQQRRRRHLNSTQAAEPVDDPWWWEIENENLILDHVPNVTTVYSDNESMSARQIDDFGKLLNTNENVVISTTTMMTLHEEQNGAAASDEETNIFPSEGVENESDKKLNMKRTEIELPREQTLEEFKEELRVKRLARQTAVQDLRDEILTLRRQLATEQALTRSLRESRGTSIDVSSVGITETVEQSSKPDVDEDAQIIKGACALPLADEDDINPESRSRHANIELANAQLALQLANADNISLRTELGVVQKQVSTLKEVIACCKQMLAVKEEQCTQLKTKLQEIEISFSEREMKIMSSNLREEYERQLVNIRQLRQLYEERQRVAAAEYENLQRLISIKKDELIAEQEKAKSYEERNQTLVREVEAANDKLAALHDECMEHKFEKRALKEEIGAVNTLFSQMVMGFNGKNDLDIDRLTQMLEENRALLNEMTQREGNCSDGATLPKLLFELVEQAAVTESEVEATAAKNICVTANPLAGNCDDGVTSVVSEERRYQGEQVATATVDATAACNEVTMQALTTTPTSETISGDVTDFGVALNVAVSVSKNATSIANIKQGDIATTATNPATAAVSLKCHEPEIMGKVASAQEIIGNLPKVWKVLMELLSHHKNEQVKFEANAEDCYKSVETSCGTKTELSVSKTYIRLKDLILEKKSLVKETNRLKTLNSHLEHRLNEQETRLSAVSLELTKTWHLVGKMQRQHRQLHTQEQILRYQLQQKRRLLNELKDELEYCRHKWAAARAKNNESQEQCDDLRREFARRKLEDANHSAESGYSDSGLQSDDEDHNVVAGVEEAVALTATADTVAAVVAASSAANMVVGDCRRKHLEEQFEHTGKIKRIQSTSPGRAANVNSDGEEIILRWNSAPPTCGWREDIEDDDSSVDMDANVLPSTSNGNGAIPKNGIAHKSRNKLRTRLMGSTAVLNSNLSDVDTVYREKRTNRIQKLEEQCKSLIQQVLKTTSDRERLEIQLCRFQDEVAPVQYAVPLDEFINRKRLERMTRASSAPATGTLTPREEEYTRKRSERLGRLEEESRQLMSRIKRTADRGNYLRCSLDRIRRAPSCEDSLESNTKEEPNKQTSDIEKPTSTTKTQLTAEEEAYTARRAARLQRLEQESELLMTQLSKNTERGENLGNKLNALHAQHNSNRQVNSETDENTEIDRPSSSFRSINSISVEQQLKDIKEISVNRQVRLRLLEQEGKELLERLTNNAERGQEMINRIKACEVNRQTRTQTQTQTQTRAQAQSEHEQTAVLQEQTTEPTLNNVACTSIVGEELAACAACVTVTTTPSQIAKQQGAISKVKPQTVLCAAQRQQQAEEKKKPKRTEQLTTMKNYDSNDNESLQDMVVRLRALHNDEPKSRQQDAIKCTNMEREELGHTNSESSDAPKSNNEVSEQNEQPDVE